MTQVMARAKALVMARVMVQAQVMARVKALIVARVMARVSVTNLQVNENTLYGTDDT